MPRLMSERPLWGVRIAAALVTAALGLSAGCSSRPPAPPAVAEPSEPEPTSAAQSAEPDIAIPPASRWVEHIDKELMPFWMSKEALGTPVGNFPTFRCFDGSLYGKDSSALCVEQYKKMGEWISDCVGRDYIRMKNRQIYAYGVAYNTTGKPEYLELMRAGLTWLKANAYDKEGIPFTYMEGGAGHPKIAYRTSQDLAHALLGPAFYYYLTRDPATLADLKRIRDYILSHYGSPEDPYQMRWVQASMPKLDKCDRHDSGRIRKETMNLVSSLDQLAVFMYLVAHSVPEEKREEWLPPARGIATSIRRHFWNDSETAAEDISEGVPKGLFAGCLTREGSTCDFSLDGKYPKAAHFTDYGHTGKTLWMIYMIGREVGDSQLSSFARGEALKLLERAYVGEADSAAGKSPWLWSPPELTPYYNLPYWWIYAELDQLTATLAVSEPALANKYLRETFSFWLEWFVDQEAGEVWQVGGPNSGMPILKAHNWKNGFHSLEHAIVALIGTAGVRREPITLYYAFAEGQSDLERQPYYFNAAEQVVKAKESLEGELAGLTKFAVEFRGIR